MPPKRGAYLLDTNVVLHYTRASPVSQTIENQFELRGSPFRPAVCEVTVAEMRAFAESWGERRRLLLEEVISWLVVIPIFDTRVHQHWARLYSHARQTGHSIQHDHNDMW